ncbi:pyruvate dehydrogenase complex dihydrolipoamide acetyltransferase [Sinisalibacter aestuarii]|nr:pyruvate dehydrogenase complex dihydrolipoamide acetyltransferase [Sinisalibacter aestuarii]
MPALSPTMEEGTLATWLIAVGDKFEAGDVVAEIETDKATMEFEVPEGGTLARIDVPAGTEGVAVGTVIATIALDGEDVDTVASATPTNAAAPAAEPAPEDAARPEPANAPQPAPAADGNRLFASPLARRIAAEKGIDLADVPGSGPRGRIVRLDVEAALSGGAATSGASAAAAATAPAQAQATTDAGPYREGTYEVVELDNMRKTIARRLTESKQTVPHFYLRADVELDALLALRSQLNAAAPAGADEAPAYKISVNDLVIKALARALHDVPDANVTWADGSMLRHHAVDVAVAVAIDGGLITPIIRDAEQKSISAISNAMKDLAARARSRKLSPEEYQGGTTSVSNLGMFGVTSFDAVINPPHGTILAVGAGTRRAVVRDSGIEAATVMTVTLSVDHRVVDGAVGAELLAAFKRLIESPLALIA